MTNSYGIAQVEGGVLTRSFEDLHPRPNDYVVVYNGTIAAQAQKADRRPPPPVSVGHATPEAILDLLTDRTMTIAEIAHAFNANISRVREKVLVLRHRNVVRAELRPNPDPHAHGRAKWCLHLSAKEAP